MAGGLEQGAWGLGRVSQGLGAGARRLSSGEGQGAGVMEGGLNPQGTDRTDFRTFGRLLVWTFARSDVRSFGRTDENSPLCSTGHRPLRVRCPKENRAFLLCGSTMGPLFFFLSKALSSHSVAFPEGS